MDALTLFGLFAVTAMLVFYALEDRSAIVHSRICGRVRYGIGVWLPARRAWPFDVIEAIWAAVAVRRWRARLKDDSA